MLDPFIPGLTLVVYEEPDASFSVLEEVGATTSNLTIQFSGTQDNFNPILSHTVTCISVGSGQSSAQLTVAWPDFQQATMVGLVSSTEYRCSLLATNDAGDSEVFTSPLTFWTGVDTVIAARLEGGGDFPPANGLLAGQEYAVELISGSAFTRISTVSADTGSSLNGGNCLLYLVQGGTGGSGYTVSVTYQAGVSSHVIYLVCTISDAQSSLRITSTDEWNTIPGLSVDMNTYAAPSAPTILVEVTDIGELTVTWSAPSDNGNAIFGYILTYEDVLSLTQVQTTLPAISTNVTVGSLLVGESYEFWLQAENMAGPGPESNIVQAVVVPGSFAGGPTVELGSSMQFATTDLVLSFSPSGDIPENGAIEFELPAGFTTSGTPSISGSDGFAPGTLSYLGVWFQIPVQNSGGVAKGSALSITISGIRNPEAAGSTADFPLVRTIDASGRAIDARGTYNSAVSGLEITPLMTLTDVILVSGDVGGAIATNGSTSVMITGVDFEPGASISVTYGPAGSGDRYSASGCSVLSSTSISCSSTEPGAGKDHFWTVSLDWGLTVVSTTSTSYAAPVITEIRDGSSLQTSGGDEVVILGQYFGPGAGLEVVSGVYGRFSFEHCEVIDDRQARCTTALGGGAGLRVAVSVGGQTSTCSSSCTLNFSPPSLLSISISELSTTGGNITLSGANFGDPSTGSVYVSYQNQEGDKFKAGGLYEATVIAHDTENILCAYPPGVGKDHAWVVDFEEQSSAGSIFTSYAPPSVLSFSDGQVSTKGQSLTVFGDSFGPASAANVVSALYRTADQSAIGLANSTFSPLCEVVADSQLLCALPPGVGRNMQFSVSVGGQDSEPSAAMFSYVSPTLSRVILPAGVTTLDVAGGQLIKLKGSNLGPLDETNYVTAIYGDYLAADCSVTAQYTTVICYTVEGVGGGLEWKVTVGGQESESSGLLSSYDRPLILGISGADSMDPMGGTLVSLEASAVGPGGGSYAISARYTYESITYEAYDCAVGDLGVVSCYAAQGVGAFMPWYLTIAGQESDASLALSAYAPPVITDIFAPRLDPWGGEAVKIIGDNFGPVDALPSPSAWYQNDDGAALFAGSIFHATNCSTTVNNTVVECTSAAGTGAEHAWNVIVGGQSSPRSVVTTSYKLPVLDSFSNFAVMPGLDTDGGQLISIYGYYIGPAGHDGEISITYQDYTADGLAVEGPVLSASNCQVSESREYFPMVLITCVTVAGTGDYLRWTATIGGQVGPASNSSTQYAPPTILQIAPSLVSTTGGEVVKLTGMNMGLPGAVVSATYNNGSLGFEPTSCEVISSQEVHCTCAPGIGQNLEWVVIVDGVESYPSLSTSETSFGYRPPELSAISVAEVDSGSIGALKTAGGDTLRLTGTNFGPAGYDTYIVASLVNADWPEFAVTIRDGACTSESHSAIVCAMPPGVGYGHKWKLSIGGQSSDWSQHSTSYKPPEVHNMRDLAGNSLQHLRLATDQRSDSEIYIEGANFGPPDILANVPRAVLSNEAIPGMPAAGITWPCSNVNDTHLVCQSAEGVGKDLSYEVFVGGQGSGFARFGSGDTDFIQISYDPPAISVIMLDPGLSYLSTDGSSRIIISGSNFGPDNSASESYMLLSLQTTIADADGFWAETFTSTECSVTSPHVEVVCSGVVGVGTNLTASILVGGQSSSLNFAEIAFHAPEITSILGGRELSTGGSQLVVLQGRDFGPALPENYVTSFYQNDDVSGLARGPFSASGCFVSVNHTEVQCESVVGVGVGHHWTLTVGGQNGPASLVTSSYAPPRVLQLGSDAAYMTTRGGENVTLYGQNFGPALPENVVSASYENDLLIFQAVDCIVTVGHVEMRCVSVPGAGSGYQWTLSVGNQSGDESASILSYSPPSINSVALLGGAMDAMSTQGGQEFVLTGDEFGPDEDFIWIDVQYGRTSAGLTSVPYVAVSCNLTVPFEQIRCFSNEGVGVDLALEVAVAGQWSNVSAAFLSYQPPVVESVSPENSPVEGRATVQIVGSDFGTSAIQAALITVGLQSACDDILFHSHTKIVCVTNPMTPGAMRMDVNIGGQSDGNTSFWVYEAEAVVPGIIPVRGGTNCSIGGAGFYDSGAGMLRIEETQEAILLSWNDALQRYFFPSLPQSAGIYTLEFTLNNQTWSPLRNNTFLEYYAIPSVTGIYPASGPLVGGTAITVSGSGFRPTGYACMRFPEHDSPGDGLPPTDTVTSERRSFQDVGDCIYVDDSTLSCIVPGGTWWYSSTLKVSRVSEILILEITIDDPDVNGEDIYTSDAAEFYYYEPPVITGSSLSDAGIWRYATILQGYTLKEFSYLPQQMFRGGVAAAALGYGQNVTVESVKLESIFDISSPALRRLEDFDTYRALQSSGDELLIKFQVRSDEGQIVSPVWLSMNDLTAYGLSNVTSLANMTALGDTHVTPQRGPTEVPLGTFVTIAATGLHPGAEHLQVRFGSALSENVTLQVSDDGMDYFITCRAPNVDAADAGVVALELSLNGLDFTSSETAYAYFRLIDFYQLHSGGDDLFGPAHGSARLRVFGSTFVNALVVDPGSQYIAHPNETISMVLEYPEGSMEFPQVNVSYPSTDTMIINMPAIYLPISTNLVVDIALNMNGERYIYVESEETFTYYSDPVIDSMSPASGPEEGGTSSLVSGSILFDSGSILAKFSDKPAISCSFDGGSALCAAPEHFLADQLVPELLNVSLSIDNADVAEPYFTPGVSFVYYGPYSVESAGPSLIHDGTVIFLQGSHMHVIDAYPLHTLEAVCKVDSVAMPLYSYRFTHMQAINLTSASSVEDYQVKMNVNVDALIAEGVIKTDCSNIRIWSTALGYFLPWWLEDCGGADANLWTRVPYIEANQTTELRILYGPMGEELSGEAFWSYGGPNPVSVFELFDDFSAIDTELWTLADSAMISGGYFSAPLAESAVASRALGQRSQLAIEASLSPSSSGGCADPVLYLDKQRGASYDASTLSARLCLSGQMCLGSSCFVCGGSSASASRMSLEVGLVSTTLQDDRCGSVSSSVGTGGEDMYLFVAGDADYDWLALRKFDDAANVEFSVGILEIASLEMIACIAPADLSGSVGITEGSEPVKFSVQFSPNGQDFSSLQAAEAFVMSPKVNAISHSVSPVQGGVNASISASGLHGSEISEFGRPPPLMRLGTTALSPASVLSSEYVQVVTPSLVGDGLPTVSLAGDYVASISFNGQQFFDLADLVSVPEPTVCGAIKEDFDFVRNDLTIIGSSSLFGLHEGQWVGVEGGTLSSACSPADDDIQYQALVFEAAEDRALVSVEVDTRFARADGTVSFSLLHASNTLTCTSLATGDALEQPIRVEYSTDAGESWWTLTLISQVGEGSLGIISGWWAYSIALPRAAASDATAFRWVQSASADIWAIDSIAVNVVPPAQASIYVDEVNPDGGPVSGGYNVTVSGSFPESVGGPYRCIFNYEGIKGDSAFSQWNSEGIEAMSVERLSSSEIRCTVPPYYIGLGSEAVCSSDEKKLCRDCCFLRVTVTACGAHTTYNSSPRDVQVSPGFSITDYAERSQFVYHEPFTANDIFPKSGYSTGAGTFVRVSEQVSGSALYAAAEMAMTFTFDEGSSEITFPAHIAQGLGMVDNFPVIGDSYGRTGMPFGSDAEDYRYQVSK